MIKFPVWSINLKFFDFHRDRVTSSSTCLVILVCSNGPLITSSPSGTNHLKAHQTESLSLWEVSPAHSLEEGYKALLAFLILFDITSGSIPTGYAIGFWCYSISSSHVICMCIYTFEWVLQAALNIYVSHDFFFTGYCRFNTMVVCCFALIELSTLFAFAITLCI